MAQIKDLIVTGASRFLNKIYANEIDVSSISTTHISLGYDNTNYPISTHGLISDEWLRTTGQTGLYNQTYGGGIYMTDSNYVRVYNNKKLLSSNGLYTGDATYYFDNTGKLNASSVVSTDGTYKFLEVNDTLYATRYEIKSIQAIGGILDVCPSFNTKGTATLSTPASAITNNGINLAANNYYLLVITDNNITSDTINGTTWTAGSAVKVNGTINGQKFNSVTGYLIQKLSTSNGTTVDKTVRIGIPFSSNYTYTVFNNITTTDVDIILTELAATSSPYTRNKVGIYIEGKNRTNKGGIQIYGGATSAPNVVLGDLNNRSLKVGTIDASGWSLYASNAFLSGTIVSSAGEIGGWTIGTSDLHNGTDSMTSTTAGLYLGTGGIRNYKDANTYVNITDGVITAKGVDLSGSITATSGTIGGCSITDGVLQVPAANISGTLSASNIDLSGYLTVSAANDTYQSKETSFYGICSDTGTARTVSIDGVESLYEGLIIYVKFASATSSSMTLNVNSLGAKIVYYQNTSTGSYGTANAVVAMVYDTTTNSSGCWKLLYSYNSDTYDRIRWNGNVKVVDAISTTDKVGSTAGAYGLFYGTSTGYKRLAASAQIDITKQILYYGSNSNISAGSSSTNFYSAIPLNVKSYVLNESLTSYSPVYLKGTLSGSTLTLDSTGWLTQTVPTTVDNKYYLYLGTAYSTSAMFLEANHPIYAYFDGKFQDATYYNLGTSGQTIINGDNITTGSIQSNNYVANTTGTKISLSDGTIDTKYFKVTSDGQITSTGGTIGGFVIESDCIKKTDVTGFDDTTTADGIYFGTNGIMLGKGVFKVTKEGVITASSGTIGGFTISEHGLKYESSDGQSDVTISDGSLSTGPSIAGASTNWVLLAGSGFGVKRGGNLHAKNAFFGNDVVIDGNLVFKKNDNEWSVPNNFLTAISVSEKYDSYPLDLQTYQKITTMDIAESGCHIVNLIDHTFCSNYADIAGHLFESNKATISNHILEQTKATMFSNRTNPLVVQHGANYVTFNIPGTDDTHGFGIHINGYIFPSKNNAMTGAAGNYGLGNNSYYWGDCYGKSWTNKSDARDKTLIEDLSNEEAYAILSDYKARKFYFNNDESKSARYGSFAQDIRDTLINNNLGYNKILSIGDTDTDEAVYDLNHPEEKSTYGLDYSALVTPLIKGWQMHEEKIKSLENEIQELKEQISQLKKAMV